MSSRKTCWQGPPRPSIPRTTFSLPQMPTWTLWTSQGATITLPLPALTRMPAQMGKILALMSMPSMLPQPAPSAGLVAHSPRLIPHLPPYPFRLPQAERQFQALQTPPLHLHQELPRLLLPAPSQPEPPFLSPGLNALSSLQLPLLRRIFGPRHTMTASLPRPGLSPP